MESIKEDEPAGTSFSTQESLCHWVSADKAMKDSEGKEENVQCQQLYRPAVPSGFEVSVRSLLRTIQFPCISEGITRYACITVMSNVYKFISEELSSYPLGCLFRIAPPSFLASVVLCAFIPICIWPFNSLVSPLGLRPLHVGCHCNLDSRSCTVLPLTCICIDELGL